ncbi:MAG: phosphate ABC transporter substrate-binding protein PstS [Candidatus Eisenbacteria bacterium]|uniref:Phosphate-binding protein n=1 Tax=Eiseniibacteriota bacterium TaxID=2212470 RepID=A0A9D6LCY8_UNCEI|nr:phosphate ABC transporter substrate-binding protein PstS [Candidatus Eisenbacteria bacterium]MBI3540419.1 phosphate ABC transporter substrate-binding protein PstS [Candidatus Eisenbacteria bacterium]
MHRRIRNAALRHARSWAVLLALASCASPAAAQKLTGAGATFPYPIYSKWFDVYKQKTGVEINYQSIGSGAGIQQVKAGTVDFGASDAALSDAQLRDMPRAIVHIPTVGGAVALAYNLPGMTGALQLTPEAITGIYMGRITTWNDKRIAAVNPGVELPAAPILAVHRSDGSGTTNIFVTYLSLVSGEWKELVGVGTAVSWPAGVGGKGNEGVAGVVRQTPGAIGYVELAYARQNRLPVARVKNRAGNFVEPTLASTTAAVEASAKALARDVRAPIANAASPEAYPICGLTFLLVERQPRDAAKGKALADFIAWAMKDGQGMADDLNYARLPAAVVAVNEATLASLVAAGKPSH